MLTFWIAAALMIVAALAFVLVPLLRRGAASGPTVRDANLAILRGQRQEIDADVALGLLPTDSRETAIAELAARADEDLAAAADAPEAQARRPWVTAGLLVLLVPAIAVGFYLWVGIPQVTDPKVLAAAGAEPGDHQIEQMVADLEARMKARPDDVQGWMLLARSFAATNKPQKALEAYAHLARIAPQDASVLADYADALALSRGRNLAGEPTDLVMRALQADPRHSKALALAGTAKLNSGDFAASLGFWERLHDVVPPGSEDATEVRNIIEDVRARAAAAGKPLPASRVAAAPALGRTAPAAPAIAAVPGASPRAAVGGKTVSGIVRLAPALAGKTAPTDTLFIYARAATGSRIPLAILRGGAGELPRAFELDDSMGMTPAAQLSTTPSVIIEARVSKAGGAVTQPGDLVGTSQPVAPGAKGVAIVIDQVVP